MTADPTRAELAERLDLAEALQGLEAGDVLDGIDAEIIGAAAAALREPAAPDLAAQNARLREALEYIAEEHDAGRHDGLREPCPAHDADTMWATARAALENADG